jgi:clan AA aspartic protease (TIGR02281 family)
MWPAIFAIDWELLGSAAVGALTALWVTHQTPQVVNGGRQFVIPSGFGNECHADVRANEHVFSMLLDTGAVGSTPLVFGRNHARDLGFDPAKLSYSYSYSSANGEGHYAKVRLRSLRLQSFVMHDVAAQITEATQSDPLLGAEILHKLNFQLKNGNCILAGTNEQPIFVA